MKKTKKNPLDSKQIKALAILHDDIDNYLKEFYNLNEENILYTAPFLTEEVTEEKKKIRAIYGLSPRHISGIKEKMEEYLFRMNTITKGEHIRSVVNKLLHAYSNGYYIKVHHSTSLRKEWKSFENITQRLISMEKKKNHPDTNAEEKILLLEQIGFYDHVYEHMNQRDQRTIALYYKSDRVRCDLYNQEEYPLAKDLFFQGGIVVPYSCTIYPPMIRKKRKDTLPEEKKYYLAAHKFFLMEE